MSHWEKEGKSDEWYTPKYIFDALGCVFDLDVAHPEINTNVPCNKYLTKDSLDLDWDGFIWMNPPFGGRNGLIPWIDKFVLHGNGIALTPDRTSAPWWHDLARKSDAILFLAGKVKFINAEGITGNQPSNGTCLFAIGEKGVEALIKAEQNGLGFLV